MMWQQFMLLSITAVITALLTALASSFFNNRNGKTALYKLAKDNAVAEIEAHKREYHKDSMYTYIEGELNKHKEGCGDEIGQALKNNETKIINMEQKLQHMEIRQTRIGMHLKFVSNVTTKIAEKMQIPIDPSLLDGVGEEE
jgi:hypothetical protein